VYAAELCRVLRITTQVPPLAAQYDADQWLWAAITAFDQL